MESHKLRGVYARLLGIRRAFSEVSNNALAGRDFDLLVKNAGDITGEDLTQFALPAQAYDSFESGEDWCNATMLKSRLEQFVSYLELVYHINDNIVEIGSLYNSIKDMELKERCSDLLSAPKNFDRAINQATQILEDRIRRKSGSDARLTGVQLVNELIKSDPAKSVLVLSNDKDEQEGLANTIRGVMQSFRNPTHHVIADKFTREDALKVCAFIDNLLRLIDTATVRA